MATVLTFCSRCGAQQPAGDSSHYAGPCLNATAVHQTELMRGGYLCCPVDACPFKTKMEGKTTSVRARFDYHLNWHVNNGVVARVVPIDGQPRGPLARLEQEAQAAGCAPEDIAATRRVLALVLGLEA